MTNIAHEVEACPSRSEIQMAIIDTLSELSGESINKGSLTREEVDTSQTLYQTRYSQLIWNMGTPTHD